MNRRGLLASAASVALAAPALRAMGQSTCFDRYDRCFSVGARSNLVLFSADLTQAAWSKAAASIVANAIAAPDGTLTAGRVVEAASTATHGVAQLITKPAAQAFTLTWSIYAKQLTRTVVRTLLEGSTSGFASCLFDLASGIPAAPTLSGAFTGAVASQINVGNGWYRCVLTALSNTNSGVFCDAYLTSAGASSYAGDGTSGLYFWGGQLEIGAAATPYMPTLATLSTRTF